MTDDALLLNSDIEHGPKPSPTTKTTPHHCSRAWIVKSVTVVLVLSLIVGTAIVMAPAKTASAGSTPPATEDLAVGMMSKDSLSLFDYNDLVAKDTTYLSSDCKAFIKDHNSENVEYRRENIQSCENVDSTKCTISYV